MLKKLLLKKRSASDQQIKHLQRVVSSSFNNVQTDVSNLSQWIQYLHGNVSYLQSEVERLQGIITGQNNTIQQQHESLQNLHSQIETMPIREEDIRQIIDMHYSNKDIQIEIEELKRRMSHIVNIHGPVVSKLNHLHEKIENIESKYSPKVSYKEKILAKITKNSKDYVKNTILALIRKYNKISALQLREIIVDEQGLCSKSSFYRLLSEIEQNDELDMVQEGKEKIYLSRIQTSA